MATRSTIAVQLKDGTIRQVYCHWDGYLEHNGKLLLNHYNSQELAELVTSGGGISSLEAKFAPESGAHSFDNPQKGVTVLYARDRGEPLEFATYPGVPEYEMGQHFEEYNYTFFYGRWMVYYDKRGPLYREGAIMYLDEALANIQEYA